MPTGEGGTLSKLLFSLISIACLLLIHDASSRVEKRSESFGAIQFYPASFDLLSHDQRGSNSIASTSSKENKGSGLPVQTGAQSEPTKEVVYPHVSMEEILRNASVIRYNYYENLPYPYVNYTYGSTFCSTYDKEMPKTTATVLKRSYMKLNKKSSVTWSNYMLKKRRNSNATELLMATLNWIYGENLCLENNTNLLHVYTQNYTHFLHLNRTVYNMAIPHDRTNYRHVLRVIPHFGPMPTAPPLFDDMYVLINRGWNNMYHHSEASIQYLRYVFANNVLPPMRTVVPFPDIDWINHRTHDFKGHYRFGRAYNDLVLDTFKSDLNGEDFTPRVFELDEYRKAGSVVCAKQGIIVPIITDMIKCFLDKKEAYQVRMLAYKRYHVPLPLQAPAKLHLRYIDRATSNRGIKNQEEVNAVLRNITDTELTVQVNQQMSFSEQVVSMFAVDILFTVHGAGLTTSVFMLPGSALVEVFPPMFREPYYMWVARYADLVYKRITESKILDKREYYNIRKKIELTNKVFYLPPEVLKEKLESVVPLVWEKKYSMVKCSSRVC